MLKSAVDIHLPSPTEIINLSFGNDCFLDDVKLTEVIPAFRKNDDQAK